MKNSTFQTPVISSSFRRLRISRGLAFGLIILVALVAFEMFNFSSTEYAFEDFLGNLTFLGIPWATILAIAFCGIDFAGIARLNTPQEEPGHSNETWYLFGAWLMAATMNAMLTWWGVSLALVAHESLGNSVVDRSTLLRVVPIFVAVLVWVIRVLIIGTFATSGNRLLTQRENRKTGNSYSLRELAESSSTRPLGGQQVSARSASTSSRSFNPATNSTSHNSENGGNRTRSL
jgi:hypothetical protein